MYGPAARNRDKVTAERANPKRNSGSKPEHTKKVRIAWASLLKKVFNVDLTKCDRCSKPVQLLGTVFSNSSVQRMLKHLKFAAGPPPRGQGTNGWGVPMFESCPELPYPEFVDDGNFSDFGV